jgi:hypothetical protein
MKQETALQWLLDQLSDYDLKMIKIFKNEIEQALEMEKQQIIDAIIFSKREHYVMGECWPTQTVIDKAERYYNETFKND